MSRVALFPTGALTRAPDRTDHRQIVEHAPALGVPGFELRIFDAWYGHLDEVVADLRETGLSFPVVHAEPGIGNDLGSGDADEVDDAFQRLELNCRAAAALGAKTLVLHLWEEPRGDAEIERNLSHLPSCLDTAAAYGLTLAVETIPGDFATPLVSARLAVERDPRCRITLDSEFLAFHGELGEAVAAEWLWAEPFVHHVHLKDFDGRMKVDGVRRYLLPGEGSLDLQGFLTGLVQRGYNGGVTVEASGFTPDGELDDARVGEIAAVVNQLAA